MTHNLDAIRKKMAQLNGLGKVKVWKPTEVGEFTLRMVPWPANKLSEGSPLIERYFYYIGDDRVLAPQQFGEHDSVAELVNSLYRSGTDEDKAIAKKLLPKLTAYMAVLVKGEESKGLQLFACNRDQYNRVLSFFVQDDVGDISDPVEGFNLTIQATHSGKFWQGKPTFDLVIDAARKPSPFVKWFGGDEEKMEKVLNATPDLDDYLSRSRKTSAEVTSLLNAWIDGGPATAATNEGTTRGKPVADKLDELASEVSEKKESKKQEEEVVKKEKKTEKKASKKDDAEDLPKSTADDLDSAFKDLAEDDD